jgi:iron complex outermembrane receptor protein
MFKQTRLIQHLVLAFGGTAAFWSSTVLAQAAPPAEAQAVQRVEVTGSNIRRTDSETPSPVQVISADEMKQSGFTSVADVLQSITANGQGTLSQGFAGAFASGASGVSLRGLTVGATLVLIDGHRSAPYPIGDDGQRSFVDISNIPFDAVERIEILKDGASAIYGSDAIAGVVNIILRKQVVGMSLGADYGTSWKGDGNTKHVTATWGIGDLAKDGRNFYVAGEFRRQDPIRMADRGGKYTRTDYTAQGGYDVTRGVPNDLNGGLARSATGYITDPDGNITGFMPGCNAGDYTAGKCTYQDIWTQIQPETKNVNLVSRFTMNLARDWQASVQGTFFESKAQQVRGPSRSSPDGYQGNTSGPGVVPTLLDALPPTTISSGNPSFPATTDGSTSGILHYTFVDVGPTVTDTDAKTTRLVGDLSGAYAGWDLQGAVGYTQVRLAVRGYGYVDPAKLQQALDSTTDPYLVGGPNSASVLSFIAPTLVSNDYSKLEFGHIGASRDLYALEGGQLALALGYDYTHRTQYAVAPDSVANGSIGSFSDNYTIGYQTVNSAYAELVAPLMKTLEAEAAVRYDHYNISGGKASPKFGFKWTPTQQFALRGTLARGFRAPGPAENGTAGQTFFTGTTNDPILCPDGPTVVGNFPTQCSIGVGTVQATTKTLKPETSKSYTLGVILEPVKGMSASIDLYQIQIDNQIVPDSNPDDIVTIRGTNLTPIPQVQADGTTKLVAPPVGPIAYYNAGFINANSTKTSGVDIDLQARTHLGEMGDLKSDLTLSYTYKYDLTVDGTTYHLAGTHGPLSIGGDTGNPRTRVKWANTWARGPLDLTLTTNYISGFSLNDPSAGVTDCPTALSVGAGSDAFDQQISAGTVPAGVSCRVGSFITFDLEGRYAVSKNLSINGSILNLFNQGAPDDWTTYGGGNAPYNPSLHGQGAIGRFMTIGATYTF